MKIIPNFDPERQLVIISVTSNLLNKYYPNFSGLIKKVKSFDGLTVERDGSDTASILFPLPENSETRRVSDTPESKLMAISMDGRKMGKIYEVIAKFVNTALNKELKKVEFLPLNGYPIEDLKKDVESAITNKRNFCVIENFSDYTNMRDGLTIDSPARDKNEIKEKEKEATRYFFNQIHFEYGTSEYADVALSIMSGDLKELRKSLIPRMEKINWI